MREAPALAGVTGPRPPSATPRRAKPRSPKGPVQNSLVGRAFARPGVTIAGAAFAALMTVVVVNATIFQKGHRPNALFGTTAHPGEVKAPPAPVVKVAPDPASLNPAPMIETQPVQSQTSVSPQVQAALPPARAAPVVPPKPVAPTVHHSKSAAAPASHRPTDSIARLLGGLSGSNHAASAGQPATPHATTPKPQGSAAKSKPAVVTSKAAPQN